MEADNKLDDGSPLEADGGWGSVASTSSSSGCQGGGAGDEGMAAVT